MKAEEFRTIKGMIFQYGAAIMIIWGGIIGNWSLIFSAILIFLFFGNLLNDILAWWK